MHNSGSGTRRSLTRRTVAAVGGLALLTGVGVGGLAVANAQDDTGSGTTTSQGPVDTGSDTGSEMRGPGGSGDGGRGPGGPGGDMRGPGGDMGGPGGPGGDMRGPGGPGGEMTEALADALGKDVETVEQALREVHEEQRTAREGEERPDTPPTEAERQTHDRELADALAAKLGVESQAVTDAMEQARAAHQDERRSELSSHLDEAVAAGSITEADAASVLKAFEAGVLGGPAGPGGR